MASIKIKVNLSLPNIKSCLLNETQNPSENFEYIVFIHYYIQPSNFPFKNGNLVFVF